MMAHKILIVEDNPRWQRIYARMVEELNQESLEVTFLAASTFAEAIAAIRKEAFDLAIVDLRLDERDEGNNGGQKILEHIFHSDKRFPVIIISGFGTAEIARDALKKYQALDFLLKESFDTSKLLSTIKEAFSSAKEL